MLHFERRNVSRCRSVQKEVARRNAQQSLFRESAIDAAGYRLFGAVTIVVPPSAAYAVLLGSVIVMALVVAVTLVEVPQRSRAIGVLMPKGGLIDVVATDSGRVREVLINAGTIVAAGELMLTMAGGDASIQHRPLPALTLRSLRKELALREQAYQRNLAMSSDRMALLEQSLAANEQERDLGRARLQAFEMALTVRERQLARWRLMTANGHASRDALDAERVAILTAQAAVADNSQRDVALAQEARVLHQSKQALHDQSALDEIQFQIDTEQIRREIAHTAQQVAGDYRAPDRRQVAHVLVQPGMVVTRGQVLAKLRRPGRHMEAWLYVSTAGARLLHPGQPVEIRLDAYPQQVFGTFSATVTSISGVALLPREIKVPLQVAGPVFEIRAQLNDVVVESGGVEWPLQPGISFRADVIQQRLKLYEWLLRSLSGNSIDVSKGTGA